MVRWVEKEKKEGGGGDISIPCSKFNKRLRLLKLGKPCHSLQEVRGLPLWKARDNHYEIIYFFPFFSLPHQTITRPLSRRCLSLQFFIFCFRVSKLRLTAPVTRLGGCNTSLPSPSPNRTGVKCISSLPQFRRENKLTGHMTIFVPESRDRRTPSWHA